VTTRSGWTLAIDTASDQAAIALFDGSAIAAHTWPGGRQQTTSLLPRVQDLADTMGVDLATLQLVAVAIGPGSFTGLRVGLSVAKGIVIAAGADLVGVPTLDIVAAPYRAAGIPCVAVVPAGRSRVVWASYAPSHEGAAVNASFADFQASLQQFPETLVVGELADVERVSLEQAGCRLATRAAGLRQPGVLAELGRARWIAGDVDDPATLAPIYLHGRPNPR
jgi:tRNA threonylcarbamoyladenosine biosynthesis protein TsaB